MNELNGKADKEKNEILSQELAATNEKFTESINSFQLFVKTFNERVITIINHQISKGIIFTKKNINDIVQISDCVTNKKVEILLRFIREREIENNISLDKKLNEFFEENGNTTSKKGGSSSS